METFTRSHPYLLNKGNTYGGTHIGQDDKETVVSGREELAPFQRIVKTRDCLKPLLVPYIPFKLLAKVHFNCQGQRGER